MGDAKSVLWNAGTHTPEPSADRIYAAFPDHHYGSDRDEIQQVFWCCYPRAFSRCLRFPFDIFFRTLTAF